jgi:hypothetical protein
MITLPDTNLELASQYKDQARARLLELQEQARLVLSQHPQLPRPRSLEAWAAETYSCTTKVIFTGAVV